jgi:hypothetical protein
MISQMRNLNLKFFAEAESEASAVPSVDTSQLCTKTSATEAVGRRQRAPSPPSSSLSCMLFDRNLRIHPFLLFNISLPKKINALFSDSIGFAIRSPTQIRLLHV